MKIMASKLLRPILCAMLALSMLFAMALPALAAIDLDHDKNDKISYVALGASNTNGFGLMGYLPDDIYENPVGKFNGSVYGYKMEPKDAYPALLADALAQMTGKTVELEQLAISSMRAEELRVLLDNSYYGDAYTEWRFTGGEHNWFNMAHPQGLDGLRTEYQNYVANADVITVDIGANNFGVYASNRILENMFDADFSRFSPKMQETLAWVRSTISSLAGDLLGGDPDMDELIDHVVDTLTYAVVGFCASFDACMERIYELNPDATVVVINIQNLVAGLDATLPGMDDPVAFGDLYGYVINIANLYTAAMSPYSGRYSFAYIGEDGQAETFLQDAKDYTGDPEDLRTAITDCFDVYDNNMFIKTRALQAMAQTMSAAGLVKVKDGYTKYTLSDMADVEKFGTLVYDNALIFDGVDVKTFLSKGDEGKLSATLQPAYNKYKASLMSAYDMVATFIRLGANSDSMDIAAVMKSYATQGDAILQTFFGLMAKGLSDPDFKLEESDEYKAIVNDPAAMATVTLGVRTYFGNSFFSHPNENGHKEICDTILKALVKDARSFFAKDSESFYVALGDGVAAGRKSYVSSIAKGLGIDHKNLASADETVSSAIETVINNVSTVEKADLVTIDFSSAAITEFMFAEMDAAISGKKPTALDWEGLLGSGASLVQMGLDEVRKMLVSQGLDVAFMDLNLADLLMRGIEGYAFAYATRMIRYGDLIDTVTETAPDALVVLIGSYNDFRNITFTMEGMTLDISSYIEYVVGTLNVEAKLYSAIEQEKIIYVQAPDVETVFAADIMAGEYSNITLMTYLNAVKRGELRPTAKGHTYIANQILEAIPLHTHTYKSECSTECMTCGETRTTTAAHSYDHSCDVACKLCGEKRAEIGEHEFSEWTVTKPATETETGINTRTCKNCGHSETETIPMLEPVVTTPGSDTTDDATTPAETTPETTISPEDNSQGGCGGFALATQLIALICSAAGAVIVIKKK